MKLQNWPIFGDVHLGIVEIGSNERAVITRANDYLLTPLKTPHRAHVFVSAAKKRQKSRKESGESDAFWRHKALLVEMRSNPISFRGI